MNIDGVTRREVEAKLATVGDYVKMDYLQACLKKQLDFDTKKFVLTKLSGIYESRKMFLEAGRLIRISADINTTYDSKINELVKSAELFIKGGNYDEADVSVAKSLADATQKQRVLIKGKIKELYKMQSAELLKRDKRKNAMDAFEKLLMIPELSLDEKKDAQDKLLWLYERLGKIKEYSNLKRAIK